MDLAHSVQRSPLLELPPELRNRVYEHLFDIHEGCAQPNLLRTCQTIRHESLDMFYSTHRFRFKNRSRVSRFAKLVGTRADHIQRVVCEVKVNHSFWGYSAWSASVDLYLTKADNGWWIGEFARDDISPEDVDGMRSRMADFNKSATLDVVNLTKSVPPTAVRLSLPW